MSVLRYKEKVEEEKWAEQAAPERQSLSWVEGRVRVEPSCVVSVEGKMLTNISNVLRACAQRNVR